jgi:hypothetical protein
MSMRVINYNILFIFFYFFFTQRCDKLTLIIFKWNPCKDNEMPAPASDASNSPVISQNLNFKMNLQMLVDRLIVVG